jgi:hypothetical protein
MSSISRVRVVGSRVTGLAAGFLAASGAGGFGEGGRLPGRAGRIGSGGRCGREGQGRLVSKSEQGEDDGVGDGPRLLGRELRAEQGNEGVERWRRAGDHTRQDDFRHRNRPDELHTAERLLVL